MEQKKFTKIVKIVTVCATCFLVLMIGIIFAQYIKLNKTEKQNAALSATLVSLTQKQQSLEEGISYRSSSAYIEQQAREGLGLIKDGETLYVYR